MENLSFKILSLEFEHLKNTDHGKIVFLSEDDFLQGEEGDSNVFGIYGQNGSGKSTAILALTILQHLFMHQPLTIETNLALSKWSDDSSISSVFGVIIRQQRFIVRYSVNLEKEKDGSNFFIKNETFKGQQLNNEGKLVRFGCAYEIGQVDSPLTMFGGDTDLKNIAASLLVDSAKALGANRVANTSVVFDPTLLTSFQSKKNKDVADLALLLRVVSNLAVSSFMVSSSLDQGFIETVGILPLHIRHKDATGGTTGLLSVNLFSTNTLSPENFSFLKEVVDQFNVVVPAFLPSMHLGINTIKNETSAQNPDQITFELVSKVNGCDIPLRCESEGTKRIISLCSSLFACYSDDAVILAIDEFDSGIFEYLFGEIVEVMAKGAAGQLIFTSHNLRPLEILAPKSLILTTTDPKNRYEFFKGLKPTNNPRDVYIRNAFLNQGDSRFYQPTSEYEISKAFMKIGDLYNHDDGNLG
jgi:AAA15 family ATPase/GTPase